MTDPGLRGWLDGIDRRTAGFMGTWGTPALRLSLAVVFVWFGILKPLGSPPS